MKELAIYKKSLIDKRRDIKSIRAYITDVESFIKFINKEITIIDYFDVERYKDFLMNSGYKITSINRKMVSIHSFFKANGLNVEIKQEKVQMQLFLNNLLSKEEIDKMIEAMELHKDYRAKCIISTLFLTGMRISEMLQLTINDVESDVVTILGKGKKYRQVLIPNKLRDIWKEYLPYRVIRPETNKLFTSQKGVLIPQTCNTILKKYGRMVGVDLSKCHNHSLRHVFCMSLTGKGVGLDTVADLAGHSNINITRIYTRKTKEQLLVLINSL